MYLAKIKENGFDFVERDLSAAINILNEGLRLLQQEDGDLTL